VERFYSLLAADRLLGEVEVGRVVREYLLEGRAAVYRVEVMFTH
jgi:hypothetical protein